VNATACRLLVHARAGGGEPQDRRCERCGSREPGSCQHRVKRSHFGEWSAPNIVWLCGSGTTGCHGWAENYPREAEPGGWALPSGADPAAVPIEHHTWGRVLLTEDGMYELTA